MHLLDRYLPIYQFSEVHACDVAAGPAATLDRVVAYRPETDRVVRFAIGLRELPTRLFKGESAARPAFGLHDFTLLDRSDDAIVCGLIGRF